MVWHLLSARLTQVPLRNLATDLHPAGHLAPQLFLAARKKSGAHPMRHSRTYPWLYCLGAGFYCDPLMSKDVIIPESKAFVSYLIQLMKINSRNRAKALLSSNCDLERLRHILKIEFKRGWLGHSEVSRAGKAVRQSSWTSWAAVQALLLRVWLAGVSMLDDKMPINIH